MEDVFIYKCPNCGGNLKLDKEKQIWCCDYCKNTYKYIGLVDNKKNLIIEKESYLYVTKCYSCDYHIIGDKEGIKRCPKCKNELSSIKKKVNLTQKFFTDKDLSTANMMYEEAINSLDKSITNQIIPHSSSAFYIECSLLTGTISINNMEYYLSNVLFPKTDNPKLAQYIIYNMNAIHLYEYVLPNDPLKDINPELEIAYGGGTSSKNDLINLFKNKYKTNNIETNLEEKIVLIPVYCKSFIYNNKLYNQYFFKNYEMKALYDFPVNDNDLSDEAGMLFNIIALVLAFIIYFLICPKNENAWMLTHIFMSVLAIAGIIASIVNNKSLGAIYKKFILQFSLFLGLNFITIFNLPFDKTESFSNPLVITLTYIGFITFSVLAIIVKVKNKNDKKIEYQANTKEELFNMMMGGSFFIRKK